MNNWADAMIINYEKGRSELNEAKDNISESIQFLIGDKKPHEIDLETADQIKKNELDKSLVNSMISDMSFVIDWLKDGREPDKLRGIDKRSVYQVNSIENMDMFPSLDIQPEERELTEDEKIAVTRELQKLSPRERQCFILREAYLWKYKDISDELGIKIPTVQKHVDRAKNKLSCHKNVITA